MRQRADRCHFIDSVPKFEVYLRVRFVLCLATQPSGLALDQLKCSLEQSYLSETKDLQDELQTAKAAAVQRALDYNQVLAQEIAQLEEEVGAAAAAGGGGGGA